MPLPAAVRLLPRVWFNCDGVWLSALPIRFQPFVRSLATSVTGLVAGPLTVTALEALTQKPSLGPMLVNSS
ncbi:hypothetical protein GALL_494800 [mine drainage metagenome]|uniref:Uncharacterized protein n=1 Tax=mine drainage metagenome TaxID=410659 RepID=A0A1J5PUG0_9ZZZZ